MARRKFQVPHTYVIICGIILLATLGTYVIPSGVYDRAKDARTGRTLVDPKSYHAVPATPVDAFDMVAAIPKGLTESAQIIFFIFICGGVFTVLQDTKALEAGLSRVFHRMRGRAVLMIPVIMLVFAILGATIGMSEEVMVFIPIGVALARASGYDDIVGMAMMSTGAAVGFAAGMVNPFTIGVAQGIAELPLFSALGFRVVGFVLLYLATVVYTLHYAARVKRNPESSYVREEMLANKTPLDISSPMELTSRHTLSILVCLVGFAYLLHGVFYKGFYIDEIATVFIMIGVVGGIAGGMPPSQIARSFLRGGADVIMGALVVGFARAILVVMRDGQIIDTVIYSLSGCIEHLPKGVAAIMMFWVQSVINFFIPSGSGQAATTMPIMAPLADILEITRQTAVTAFHYGDGFSNQIIPTSGTLLGALAMAKIPWEKWVRFIWPLLLIWTLIGSFMCYISAVTNVGPF